MLMIADELATYARELFPAETVADSFKKLIENEFVRRLVRYRRTVTVLENKYQTTFEDFQAQQMIQKLNYSMEVEQDFCDWEMARDGITTIEKKLAQLRETKA
ncbi:hypothetical protein L0128_19185 [candidate division KSB1 bacterium]|nr:hypothetical protein [candidate division KSB1 bacterium]